ncbi:MULTISPECIES: dermonecrotic toxin domain-containing protein [Pseudomonas]|uniref:dermonecrotic toxin domain-containing protein n=1 Tax=Pseudomonas TaxID=286 RepID=UPI0011B0D475|nr:MULTISPECIES: DUF6543 domain-containing protein [Pseudomonas]
MHTAPVHAAPSVLQHQRFSIPSPTVQAPITQPRPTDSPHETALLHAYLEAVQRKVLHNNAGLIKVPPESTLGQWLGLYRAFVEHPVVQGWLREQKIDASALLSIDPFKGTLSAEADGKTKTFHLSDTSGWAQVSGPLLAAAKVIAPEDKGPLRVRFGEGFTQVSAKDVANFQGIPLPSRRAQANEQIRHLEQQKAFDPIAADDRTRPASSRSAQALAVHQQNAAKFYGSAPQALEYKRLAVGVATHLPNTRAEAKKWAEAMIFKLTGKQVDADTLYFNRFDNYNTPLYGATASGTEHLDDEPKSSLRLPDALLKNFSAHDGIPGELDTHSGLYTVGYGAGAKGGYGARNEFPLAPSKLMHESWKTDFQGQMDKKIESFWRTHTENYEAAIKGEFTYQARKQLKAAEARPAAEQAVQPPELRFTREDYRLIMGAVSNLPLDENAPLSVEQLRAKAAVNATVQAHALDIHGIASSDILRFSAQDGRRQVLYIPGAEPAFLRFDSLDTLNEWLSEQARNPKKREALAAHFPLAARQDHAHKPGLAESMLEGLIPVASLAGMGRKTKGLDTLLDEMASASLNAPAVTAGRSKIEGDVFSTLASATKARMSSDADVVIKSNSEVIRDTWLNDITVAAGLLAKLAPIAAPVAAAAVITGLTEVALGEEKAYSGDNQAERKDGASKAFDGLLNTLFSIGASARPEDPFAIAPESGSTPLKPRVQPERPVIEEPQPGTSRGNRVIDEPAKAPLPRSISLIPMAQYAVADGEALIKNATRDAQGVYRITDSTGAPRQFVRFTDETGKSNVYEISGQYRSGNPWAKIMNPENGAGLMVVTPGRNGEWARAPGDGGAWWKRAAPPSPSAEPKAPPRLSDEFLELNGSKMKGADTLDNYFRLDENHTYTYGITLTEQGETVPQISWVSEENPEWATQPPKANTPGFGTNDYSDQFIKDLNRSRLTIKKPDGSQLEIDVGEDIKNFQALKGTLASEEEIDAIKQQNIEALERFMPDPALRARVSEVANQWLLAPIPEEFRTPRLKEPMLSSGGEQHYYVNYDPASATTTVTGETDFKLSRLNTENGELEPLTDITTHTSRTVTFRASNDIDSDGYVMDKSAPIRIQITPKLNG